jgi:VWFA-related protein
MRKIFWTGLIFFFVVTAFAQEPKFRSDARLVLVPAVIKDKSGNHVPGMTKEQFKLMQDGKEQPIGVFEEVKASRENLVPVPTKLPEFSNMISDMGKPRALVVIAFDTINTPVLAMTQVKQDLLKYLSQLAEQGDPTALVTLEGGRSRVIYDFTSDPKAIAAAVARLKARIPAGQNSSALSNDPPYLSQNGAAPDVVQSTQQLDVLERQLNNWIHSKINEDNAQRIQQRQTRRDTLEALRNLAASLKPFPGRKTLIWVTGGFPYAEDTMQLQDGASNERRSDAPRNKVAAGGQVTGSSAPASGNQQAANPDGSAINPDYSTAMLGAELTRNLPNSEAMNDHTRTWGVLNDANVAVYPVDARRLVNTGFDNINPDVKYSSRAVDREMNYTKAQEVVTTFENIAAATGGKPCYGRAELTDCFKEALDDSDSYYLLGYYVPEKTKAGWHKLQVKASSKDTNIRARNGFMYSDIPLSSRPAIQSDLAYAVAAPLNAIAVPFRGAFLGAVDHNGKKAMQFQLNLPLQSFVVDEQGGNHIALDVAVVAFSLDGKPAGTMGQTIDTRLKPEALAQIQQGGLTYKNLIELAAGDYQVRFVVRDNLTGRIGSVMTNVKVE